MSLHPGVVVALLAACAFPSGCGNNMAQDRACTEIGCNNGLTWAFSRPLRESGNYVIELQMNGVQVTCQATLPFAGCATQSPCSSDGVLLEQSGCALPATEHSLGGLHILSSPPNARLTIKRDGRQLVSGEVTPTYVRSQPNGEGCPPVCEQASATLTIP